MFYNCYKNVDNKKFEEELKMHLSSMLDFESSHLAFKTTLNWFALLKQNFCVKQQLTFHDKNPP